MAAARDPSPRSSAAHPSGAGSSWELANPPAVIRSAAVSRTTGAETPGMAPAAQSTCPTPGRRSATAGAPPGACDRYGCVIEPAFLNAGRPSLDPGARLKATEVAITRLAHDVFVLGIRFETPGRRTAFVAFTEDGGHPHVELLVAGVVRGQFDLDLAGPGPQDRPAHTPRPRLDDDLSRREDPAAQRIGDQRRRFFLGERQCHQDGTSLVTDPLAVEREASAVVGVEDEQAQRGLAEIPEDPADVESGVLSFQCDGDFVG